MYTETITIKWRYFSEEKPQPGVPIYVKEDDSSCTMRKAVYCSEGILPTLETAYAVWTYHSEVKRTDISYDCPDDITQESVRDFVVFLTLYHVDTFPSHAVRLTTALIRLKDGTVIHFHVPYYNSDPEELTGLPCVFKHNGEEYVMYIQPNSPHHKQDKHTAVIRRMDGEGTPVTVDGFIHAF